MLYCTVLTTNLTISGILLSEALSKFAGKFDGPKSLIYMIEHFVPTFNTIITCKIEIVQNFFYKYLILLFFPRSSFYYIQWLTFYILFLNFAKAKKYKFCFSTSNVVKVCQRKKDYYSKNQSILNISSILIETLFVMLKSSEHEKLWR